MKRKKHASMEMGEKETFLFCLITLVFMLIFLVAGQSGMEEAITQKHFPSILTWQLVIAAIFLPMCIVLSGVDIFDKRNIEFGKFVGDALSIVLIGGGVAFSIANVFNGSVGGGLALITVGAFAFVALRAVSFAMRHMSDHIDRWREI